MQALEYFFPRLISHHYKYTAIYIFKDVYYHVGFCIQIFVFL